MYNNKEVITMPKITSSADLRNKYNEISSFCNTYNEPVFITKNGKGDLAVMSIETYEMLTARFELYTELKKGLDAAEAGDLIPADEAFKQIEEHLKELSQK